MGQPLPISSWLLPLFGTVPSEGCRYNQLVGEILSIWRGTRPSPACRTLFLTIPSKDRNAPFIHLQDCPGLLLIYEVVPIDPPPPCAALTRLCVLPLFPSHGLEHQMGWLCLALGVRHTPPLILPSESLPRTMANICEPPKCSIRKKRPGGGGLKRSVEY